MKHESGNSQLLNEYRAALINAYCLGEEIKDLYGIVPPKVISEKVKGSHSDLLPDRGYSYVPHTEVVIGLTIN